MLTSIRLIELERFGPVEGALEWAELHELVAVYKKSPGVPLIAAQPPKAESTDPLPLRQAWAIYDRLQITAERENGEHRMRGKQQTITVGGVEFRVTDRITFNGLRRCKIEGRRVGKRQWVYSLARALQREQKKTAAI